MGNFCHRGRFLLRFITKCITKRIICHLDQLAAAAAATTNSIITTLTITTITTTTNVATTPDSSDLEATLTMDFDYPTGF